jgi:hypothetical protein
MWWWRKLEKIIWTYRVGNEEVLQRAKEEVNISHKKNKERLTGLVTSWVKTAF